MKVLFLGTSDFSATVLENLYNSKKHEIVGVVTKLDKPTGRGQKLISPAVKVFAQEHNIPCFQFKSISNEGYDVLSGLDADVMVTAAFGQILKQNIIGMTKYGVINVHASLLPKYRGSSPIQWAIIKGEKKSGVTIMQTDIGKNLGNRDHTTILHGRNKIEKELVTDESLQNTIEVLIKKINPQ